MIKKRALQKFGIHFYLFQTNFASLRGPKWVLFRLKRFLLEALMGANRWRRRGTRTPHFFRQWGYNMPCPTYFTL